MVFSWDFMGSTLWLCQNSYGNGHRSSWAFPRAIMMFHGYIKLPDGKSRDLKLGVASASWELWWINIDPENHPFLVETNHPTPMNARVELLIYWRVYSAKELPFEHLATHGPSSEISLDCSYLSKASMRSSHSNFPGEVRQWNPAKIHPSYKKMESANYWLINGE